MPDPRPDILRPGETCWRVERAERLALFVDAADYFAALKGVVQQARHSVMMIGWEFDTRIRLDPRDRSGGVVPDKLGQFLGWVTRQRPDLTIHLLEWDLGILKALGRGSTPLRLVDWLSNPQIPLRMDRAHPSGSAHHQKIVVIDDVLAFCGGIDMTAGRWDTREHLDKHPLRFRPTTRRALPPWHDATMAVDGAAAKALGELARERWERATGQVLQPPPAVPAIWPQGLPPLLRGVDVGIARTAPEHDGRQQVNEIETLYLSIIAATRRVLYIESQYFASRRVAEAIAARLREAEGPEIVIVNPESADGWLEEAVMGSSRARLLKLIGEADIHGRFRLYTPVTKGGTPIYVHAKILVMDDLLLRVGSSNLNNRSMGFDTECDLVVEAQDQEMRRAILGVRDDLLAEHLGVTPSAVAEAVAQGGLIAAIEALRSGGRSLRPFVPPELNGLEKEVLAENDLLDPERPGKLMQRMLRRVGLR